jgi:AcrR family transcriptional regulator
VEPGRVSRRESQARTRARLLESARRICARDGLDRASIERVAEGAGHTRGAFYAHFDSKEELYLAMLEERFDSYLEDFSRALATDEAPEIRARRAGDQLSRMIDADPEGQRLFYEFAVYALRNEQFRKELVGRYRSLRERVAEVFRLRAKEYGVESPIPLERVTLMTFAIALGVGLDQLLEPDRVPEELHGELLAIFFAGLGTLGESGRP